MDGFSPPLSSQAQRAAAIFQGSPNTAPRALADVYRGARGVEIDPIYVRALGFDILCMLAAFAEAEPLS